MSAKAIRSLLVLLILVAGLSSVGCTSPCCGRDGVFMHIKSGPDEPHNVLMGLRMAQLMADDRDVLVYFDVQGINVVTADAADLAMEPFGESTAMIQDLLDQNVPLYACPGCLKAAGKTPEQLLPGVQVANKEAFFAFTRGRILTLDY